MPRIPDTQIVTETSSKAIEKMETNQIAPTPENYHLWYTYSGEYDPGLTKIIEKLVSQKIPIDNRISKELYNKFFTNGAEKKAIKETGDGFKAEIAKIMELIKAASADTSVHTESLTNQIDELSGFDGGDEIKNIIKLVINDVKNITNQTKVLEKQLANSSEKIDGLKTNLENARIESRTDALTNIGNRKFFDEKLSECIEKANGSDKGFCLIISDIDFFKKFNDTFGHQIGDQVLKVVAHVLKTSSHSNAHPFRYGGEEFAILVPESEISDVYEMANTIRKAISIKSIKNKNTGQDFGKITMSFGIAEFRKSESPELIIERADAALYLAKENGRNRVQIESDLVSKKLQKMG